MRSVVQDRGTAAQGRGGKRWPRGLGGCSGELIKGTHKASGSPGKANYKNGVEFKVSYNVFFEIKHCNNCTHVKTGLGSA